MVFGSGVYAHDSAFQVAINRGTDAVWLIIGVPWLAYALWRDICHHTPRDRQRLGALLGVLAYLAMSGVALFVAWLPDIIASGMSGRMVEPFGLYTTPVTHALDMGIVAPVLIAGAAAIVRHRAAQHLEIRATTWRRSPNSEPVADPAP